MASNRVLINFVAETKEQAIGKLVDCVVNGFDREEVLASVLEREQLGSTGVGHGVAIPHVRIDAVNMPLVVFGRSARPIEFAAMDQEPCSLFFLVLGPTRSDAQEPYLQAMAKISRLMRNGTMRQALMSASSPEALLAAIVAGEPA
jgi:PTS system nitrogen regulatory IIA component